MVAEHHHLDAAIAAYASIFDASPLPTVVLDRAGYVQVWNRAAERTLGWSVEEVVGKRPPSVPEQERAPFELQFQQALRGETVTGVEARRRTKGGRLLDVRLAAAPLRTLTGQIIGVVWTFEDVSERRRGEEVLLDLLAREQQARAHAEETRQRLSFLADAGDVLASSLDYETTLTSVAQLAVSRIADWCTVHVVDEDGEVRQIAVTHPDPARLELVRQLERHYPYDPRATTGVPQVLRTGEPELTPEISDEILEAAGLDADALRMLRELGLRSSMIVPIVARGHTLGAITFVAAESGRHYGPEDLTLAQELARRAGLAVDNARLYAEAQRVARERSAILVQMAEGVAIVNAAGEITFLNAAARRMSGGGTSTTSLAAALESHEVTTVDGELYPLDRLPILRALRNRETIMDAQWLMRGANGSEIALQGTAAPLLGDNGELLGAVSTFRDVTAQHTLEQQKDDFLSAAAHDLKTPLTSLKGLAQILQRRIVQGKVTEPKQLLEGLERIERNATRMTAMINELLDVTRLQMGAGLDLNRRPTDLVALVLRCAEEQQEVADNRITVHTVLPELLGMWDTDRLERAISNLLSNAIKYSSEDTPIAVSVAKHTCGEGACAVLSVRDHGIGIPADDLPHIFERFHRARNVGYETMGTGIGLAGVKEIVELHGGSVEVESQEGAGSTFTVRLPLTGIPDVSATSGAMTSH